jgi:broad specificity phosphatase PhoE
MAHRNIYLIRHGQYQAGATRGEDYGLTALGRTQAALIADAFRHVPIHAIRCSTLRRAIETAQAISMALGVSQMIIEPDNDLREAIPCIPAHFAERLAQFMPDFTPEQAEAERARADAGFARYFRPPDEQTAQADGEARHEIIVCHGNLIQYYTCLALGAGIDRWLNLETYHGGISHVQIGASGLMKVIGFNSLGHIPPELRTHH